MISGWFNKLNRSGNSAEDKCVEDHVYSAALRAMAPSAPIIAVVITASIYIGLGEFSADYVNITNYSVPSGAFAVVAGIIVTIALCVIVALICRGYTSARSASRRNYHMLSEKLSRLKSRIKHSCPESQVAPENAIDRTTRIKLHQLASEECKEIEKGLESSGMPWVTGIGYVELWHRVHRAEEALVKLETHTEAISGAVRDELRLMHSNIVDRDVLLQRLRCSVAVLDDSETGENLNYLAKSEECKLPKEEREKRESRAKALTLLSEIRYEINYFRDNVWEGLVTARNRLIDTSLVLGFITYALLGLAIFLSVPYDVIYWVCTYFLIGALAGLFARSQAEWSANSAVDDFGLSFARLIHVPWLSGIAAVGGVLVTALVDGQITATSSGNAIESIFAGRPISLIVAAVFGITPDLIIRRLTEETDKYKDDLQSTETSKSIESGGSTVTRPASRGKWQAV